MRIRRQTWSLVGFAFAILITATLIGIGGPLFVSKIAADSSRSPHTTIR
jgi:hypothetical protein